jgi:hypothetical protein
MFLLKKIKSIITPFFVGKLVVIGFQEGDTVCRNRAIAAKRMTMNVTAILGNRAIPIFPFEKAQKFVTEFFRWRASA